MGCFYPPAILDQLAALSGPQLSDAFAKAGMGAAAQRHGNAFNQIRAGNIDGAVGTLKAGCSPATHKKSRKMLRRALREAGVNI